MCTWLGRPIFTPCRLSIAPPCSGATTLVAHQVAAERTAGAAGRRVLGDAEARARTSGCRPSPCRGPGSVEKRKIADLADVRGRVQTCRRAARIEHGVVDGAARRERHEQERHAARHDLDGQRRAGDRRRRRPSAAAAPAPDRRCAPKSSGAAASSTRRSRSPSRHVSVTGVGPTPRPKTKRSRSGPMTPRARERERAADRRVAGHRQLVARREDAHPDVGVRPLRRQDERRLRERHLLGDRLHRLGRQAAAVEEDGQLVAAEQAVGEDVEVKVAI